MVYLQSIPRWTIVSLKRSRYISQYCYHCLDWLLEALCITRVERLQLFYWSDHLNVVLRIYHLIVVWVNVPTVGENRIVSVAELNVFLKVLLKYFALLFIALYCFNFLTFQTSFLIWRIFLIQRLFYSQLLDILPISRISWFRISSLACLSRSHARMFFPMCENGRGRERSERARRPRASK